MIAATLTFHVPPDASPEAVRAIVSALSASTDAWLPLSVLREQVAALLGRPPRGEALALLRDLALAEQTGAAIRLTARGRAVSAAQELGDLVHGLSYACWSPAEPERLSRMWTYRTVVDLLWDAAPVTIDPSLKKRLVEDLLGRAEDTFGAMAGFCAAGASIGPKSIDGVLRWLVQLQPAVLRERALARRQRCPPSLMALTLAATARAAGAELGTDFNLGLHEREQVARACFLEPTALDTMLDWTVQTQAGRLRWGATNARYGRQLVLLGADPLA